ncbi:MAG: PilX N-terminal domain-containing pilus assembly protein [Arenimonas sp.]
MTRQFPASLRSQKGATLAVVLVLLLVLILLGLASIRGTLLEQWMSTSELDRSLSFQATEAALREGEAVAATKPAINCTAAAGVCAAPGAGIERWRDADGNGAVDPDDTAWNAISRPATAMTNAVNGTAIPRYIIEVMAVDAIAGSSCTTSGDLSPDAACSNWESRYRVTARSAGGGRSEVVLQSNIAVP